MELYLSRSIRKIALRTNSEKGNKFCNEASFSPGVYVNKQNGRLWHSELTFLSFTQFYNLLTPLSRHSLNLSALFILLFIAHTRSDSKASTHLNEIKSNNNNQQQHAWVPYKLNFSIFIFFNCVVFSFCCCCYSTS